MKALAALALGAAIIGTPAPGRAEDKTEASNDDAVALEALIERAEATPWPWKSNSERYRVKRDDDGGIVSLRLDGLTLSAAEFQLIARIDGLERLSLSYTNVSDDDIAVFVDHPTLKGMRFNSTGITDAGVKHLQRIPQLESLCLGKVAVNREAVVALKTAHDENYDKRRLGIGYALLSDEAPRKTTSPESPQK